MSLLFSNLLDDAKWKDVPLLYQNSSAHVVRSGHLDAAAVLAHGSPQRPIGLCSKRTKLKSAKKLDTKLKKIFVYSAQM